MRFSNIFFPIQNLKRQSLIVQLIITKKLISTFRRISTFNPTINPMNLNHTFEAFIGGLLSEKKNKNYLKKATDQYDILKYKISNLSVLDIKKMYYKIIEKYSENQNSNQTKNSNQQNGWLINELKIFVWIVVCYAFQEDQHLSSLNTQGWNFLVSVFYFKPVEILQYHLLSLLKGDSLSQARKWSHAQNDILKSILRDPQLQNKWNQISKLFFLKSEKKYFRKPQKCREHWNNHLNPVISHDPWTLEEEVEMIEHVNTIGKKWSYISTILGANRTEHMVKNRFKSLQKKFEKEIMQSEKREIQAYMLTKRENEKDQQPHGTSLMRIESTQMTIDQKTNQCPINLQPTSIEPTPMEQETFQDHEIQNLGLLDEQDPYTYENLIQVPQDKFFFMTKRSLGLMSQIDEEMQKYFESFLF